MHNNGKGLLAYFIVLTILCASFIIGARALGENGMYLAQGYMITPALAAIIARFFFYKKKFTDTKFKMGKAKDYFKYWAYGLLIVIGSYPSHIL